MARRPGAPSLLRPPAAAPALLLARDYAPEELARMLASGSVMHLRRGAYLRVQPDEAPADLALAHLVAAHHLIRTEHCFSHHSAALLHGLASSRTVTRPSLYQATPPHGAGSSPVTRHTPLPPVEDRAIVAGLPATTLSRTVWDCLTSMKAPDALVVADAALSAGVTVDELAARARRGGRGHARALATLGYADDGAESAPESICRYRLLRAGFPVPTTQIRVPTRLGVFWGDLGWPEWKVLVEYDGRIKYDARPAETFMVEKRRHDALVEEGWGVTHVTNDDLRVPGAFESRMRQALPPAATLGMRPRRELRW